MALKRGPFARAMGAAMDTLHIGDDIEFAIVCMGPVSASPTVYLLRGYGRADTQNDRLGEAVILSTGTRVPAQ